MSASLWVSLGSFLVAGLAALGTLMTRGRQTALEKKWDELAERELATLKEADRARLKANVTVRYYMDGRAYVGADETGGRARGVEVEILDRDGTSAIPRGEEEKFPLDLEPGESIYAICMFSGGPGRPKATARWTNPDGTLGEREFFLDQ